MNNSTTTTPKRELSAERRAFLDSMVTRSKAASGLFMQYSQAECDQICKSMALTGIARALELALMAVQETEMGVVEDKIIKNMVSSEFVWDHIKNIPTVGIIKEHPKQNLSEVAEPHGVIFGLTPVTNPTSTVIFKCLMAMKTRNTVIFSPHQRAAQCSARAAELMHEAAVKAGAPENCIQCIPDITLEDVEYLFRHPDVALIDATGGTGMVKAAYSSGKPALGVGAGNTPVYIESTADIEMAVVDILTSKTFDNGTICASEQTVIVDEAIYDDVLDRFRHYGAHICNDEEVHLLGTKTLHRGFMKPSMIGKPPAYIAEKCGINIAEGTKLFLAPLKGIGDGHPLSGEKLFPVLGLYRARDAQEAINIALDINYYGGTGHTASIFSRNEDVIREYSDKINAGRIIVNSPSSIGALGGVYNDLEPTFSFGCGTGGGNITMDNINVQHYLNIKKVARRTTASMWFRAPNEIYFNQNSVEFLRTIQSQTTIVITTPVNEKLGHVEMVERQLTHVPVIEHFTNVSPEPPYSQVQAGVELCKRYNPDTIIAVGGGSVLDIAKAIRFFYEHPEVDFNDLKVNFLDPRKRIIQYPEEKSRIKLIAVPTTSGTGSEVTPFAVITDDETHQKISMADYNLAPDIAIVDPNFTMTVPPAVTVDTGLDTLTHALESMVSSLANDYTDGLALSSIMSVFKHLETCYREPSNVESRQRMHNASCMAGMAFANAFLGVNHALAHAVGATFGVAHGRANAIFLPYVIRYNSEIPTKFTPNPNVKTYKADKKYAYIAEMIHLNENGTVPEKVQSLIDAIRGLMQRCDVPLTFRDYGIAEQEFKEKLPLMVNLAMIDPSGRSNPRMPMITEISDLLMEAYYGQKVSQ
ncbi:MAG: bifunctional acetaldehyde-CoA/alcohol dehydrogenase [Leptospiraceae bacterium]|nr:bifunctional acetaldehyde-CoA/alcohol dehydrogenase [Leptospiraceae bacterium]